MRDEEERSGACFILTGSVHLKSPQNIRPSVVCIRSLLLSRDSRNPCPSALPIFSPTAAMLRVFNLTARTNSEPGQAEAVVGHTWCGALTSDEVSSALWVPEPRGGRAKAFGFRRGHNMERGRPSRDGAADWRLVTPYLVGPIRPSMFSCIGNRPHWLPA